MTYDYDLFVIGGGSGGVRAARVAAAEMKAMRKERVGDRTDLATTPRVTVPATQWSP